MYQAFVPKTDIQNAGKTDGCDCFPFLGFDCFGQSQL